MLRDQRCDLPWPFDLRRVIVDMADGRLSVADEQCPFLKVYRRAPAIIPAVIPEIDIWRVANLMLKRYGDHAEAESAGRADELAANGDTAGVAVWRRIIDAIGQLASTTPPGLVH
jgi:hypothetical protein